MKQKIWMCNLGKGGTCGHMKVVFHKSTGHQLCSDLLDANDVGKTKGTTRRIDRNEKRKAILNCKHRELMIFTPKRSWDTIKELMNG